MKVVILYRPNTEHERSVLTFEHDFNRQTGHNVELVSLDTLEGAEMAKLYDITAYPAVIAKSNDGVLLKQWSGGELPLINELSYYASDD